MELADQIALVVYCAGYTTSVVVMVRDLKNWTGLSNPNFLGYAVVGVVSLIWPVLVLPYIANKFINKVDGDE